jgi:hypothetical protein
VGYATTMMKKTGPSHAVGYQSSKEGEQRVMRRQEMCVQTYKNQKPKSLGTADVVRDVEKLFFTPDLPANALVSC